MPNVILPNLGIELPDVGSDADTWGNILNSDLSILDTAVQYDVTTKTLSNANVTLTDVEAASTVIRLTGTLTANVQVIVPTTPVRAYVVSNATTGAFTVTVKTAAGTGVVVPQTKNRYVAVDNGNVVFVEVDTALNSTNGTNVNVTQTSANAEYPIVFSPDAATGQKALLMDSSGGTYNPSTNTATLNVIGNQSGGSVSATSLSYSLEGTTTSTSAFQVPVGSTAQRPTGANGKIRFNTTTGFYEGYYAATGIWNAIGGGAAGGGTDQVFYENSQTVTTDYTITTNKNAMSAGPITINNGITVTVPNGSVWTVV